jgi:hypothetical protein
MWWWWWWCLFGVGDVGDDELDGKRKNLCLYIYVCMCVCECEYRGRPVQDGAKGHGGGVAEAPFRVGDVGDDELDGKRKNLLCKKVCVCVCVSESVNVVVVVVVPVWGGRCW